MNNIEVDAREVNEALAGLRNSNIKSAYRAAIKRALNKVKKETVKNLRLKHKSKDMSKGVKVTVKKSGDEGKVHIMGDYRLKWFEKGTKKRKTKKGYNRGKIEEERFFDKARTAKESEVFDGLESDIKKEILKRWERKK